MPPFATVLETNGCAMPSVNGEHYSLNRPFEGVRTQNANNVRHSPSGRRMGVNRDFMAYKKTQWLPFPPAVFAETRRPRSSYRFAYGRRASAAAAIGKRSYHGHWGPDHTSTGQNSRDTPPLYLVPLGCQAHKTCQWVGESLAAAARTDSCTNSRRGIAPVQEQASQASCAALGAAGPTLSLQQESISGSKRSEAACATKPEPS